MKLEIDGKTVEAKPGSMIIEAADEAGVYIPRFCYHKKLSIAANCRMCLVEVEKAPKALPACATPVTDGMVVLTKSKKALEAQKYVLEFLLVNHPLDCPICDQGGECELQDLSMGFGRDDSAFTETKRSVADDDMGSLIATEMTRCIHCTRCVRFGREVAGVREMGMLNRGGWSQISTYVKHTLESELSGNIIDLCPVGALTSKPYRFTTRTWELSQHDHVSPHDCVGSHLHVHTRNDQVMRVVPKDHESINETWISDRDRFSYCALSHEDALTQPMIKHQGQWQTTTWSEALAYAAKGLKEIVQAYETSQPSETASQIAGLLSPNTSMEEGYLFQKLVRDLGSENIDFRLQQQDFSDDEWAAQSLCQTSIADLEQQHAILLVGSNIHREQPILGHRVRTATLQGGKVFALNVFDCGYNFDVQHKCIVHPQQMVQTLAGLCHALASQAQQALPETIKTYLTQSPVTEQIQQLADQFTGENKTIVLGALSLNHPQASEIRALARVLAQLTGASIMELPAGANTTGLAKVGALPSKGLNTREAMLKQLKAYVLYNVEPELDCANPAAMMTALTEADFVLSFSAFRSADIEKVADIILPIATFAEAPGTYQNIEGESVSVRAATLPKGEARPGWKVLRVLANLLELEGYQYTSHTEVYEALQEECQQQLQHSSPLETASHVDKITLPDLKQVETCELVRITEWPLYRADGLVRRSQPLQECGGNESLAVGISPATAQQLGLTDAQRVRVKQLGSTELPLTIDSRLPNNCIYLPTAYTETAMLGDSFGTITLEKL